MPATNENPAAAGEPLAGRIDQSLDNENSTALARVEQASLPTDKRGWALWYVRCLNARTFPIRPNDTKPAIKENLRRATRDEVQIRVWWTNPLTGESTDHNIGVVCDGGEDGFVVADLDPKNNPTVITEFELLLDLWGADEPTLIIDTPNGGRHYYYRTSEPIGSGAHVNGFLRGLDTRGGGTGYVVGAGSTRTIKTGPGKNDVEVRAYKIRSFGGSNA